MGFLFQHAALYDSLTVEQNVAFPLQHHRKEMSKSEQADRVRQLLAEVGMEGDLDKMPSDISGGMQKRVGLARALALEPDILLLDEPTAGLDPISSAEIDDLVLKLQQEHHMASIVVTHDLHSAKTIADRLALLNEGNVVIEGNFEELQKSDIEFVREFLEAFVGGYMSRAARLGAFIVATLAILVVGVFIIGGKQYLFSSTYQLKAQFDNVAGLDAGGDVRVGGVHSGTVRNIVLPHKPGEKVTVVMDLGKSTHEIIKQDSVATIETEGLLGNQFWRSRLDPPDKPRCEMAISSPASRRSKWQTCSKRRAAFWIAASKPSRTPRGRRRI